MLFLDEGPTRGFRCSWFRSPSVVSEARSTKGVRELGVIARFRYNDLKEAAALAAGAGPMQIEWSGEVACRRAGVVRGTTTADTMGHKVDYDERVFWRACLKKSGRGKLFKSRCGK